MTANILRWILALPAGLLAAFLIHLLNIVSFGIAHGFDTVFDVLEATDMNGMPITGTYIVFVARASSSGVFMYATISFVPNYKKQVALILTAVVITLLIISAVILVAILNYAQGFGVVEWYRVALELISCCTGVILGAILVSKSEENAMP